VERVSCYLGHYERVSEDELLHLPKLTDGVIFLRPLNTEDAAEHLAGEDGEMAKWVSGGRSTPASVEAFIRNNQESWRVGGPRRAFGIFDCASNRLAGFIEVNVARLAGPGQVNISYGVFRQWRRQGLALRAIDLMPNICEQQLKPAKWSSGSSCDRNPCSPQISQMGADENWIAKIAVIAKIESDRVGVFYRKMTPTAIAP